MTKMKELYKKVAADADLQQKVSKILEAAGEDADAAGKNLVAFAKEQGYDVTVDEIKEFFNSLSEISDGPLSEEELDVVAGGKVSIGNVSLGNIFVACKGGGGGGGGGNNSIITLGAGCLIIM